MNKYKYSFDLGAFFGSEEKETKLKAAPEVETSILPRPKQKQEAVQEAKPEYDPYGFIPDFAAAYEGAGGVPTVGSDLPLPAGQEQERYAQAVDSLLSQLQTELSPQPDLTAATPALNLEPPVIADREERAEPVQAEAIQAAVEEALGAVNDVEETTPVTTEAETTGGAGLMSRRMDSKGETPSPVNDVPENLIAPKGPAYRDSKVVSYSYYKKPIEGSGPRGKSRRGGDASKAVQEESINAIIKEGRKAGMSKEDIALTLAIARHESGFNPDAAAGTTSAHGLGQFVNKTGKFY